MPRKIHTDASVAPRTKPRTNTPLSKVSAAIRRVLLPGQVVIDGCVFDFDGNPLSIDPTLPVGRQIAAQTRALRTLKYDGTYGFSRNAAKSDAQIAAAAASEERAVRRLREDRTRFKKAVAEREKTAVTRTPKTEAYEDEWFAQNAALCEINVPPPLEEHTLPAPFTETEVVTMIFEALVDTAENGREHLCREELRKCGVTNTEIDVAIPAACHRFEAWKQARKTNRNHSPGTTTELVH